MRKIFGGSSATEGRGAGGPRVSRHSSGWTQLRADLRDRESLRVLDIGPTSSTNINLLTGLGHSLYMANLVEEAARPEWKLNPTDEHPASFEIEKFLAANLDFAGRTFNVVTFWDSADYLPADVVAPIIERLHSVMEPGGKLLAFFHSKAVGPDTAFHRYHLTDSDNVELQGGGSHVIQQVYNNREIENLFKAFSSYRFFLAKDNLREVLVTR